MVEKSLIIGAAFVDIIMDISQMLKSGGDVTARLKSYNVGGCAFNVYGAIKHELGSQACDLFVPVGHGQYSQMVRRTMQKNNIPILIDDDRADNGWDLCLVEPNGERTFITVPGIEQHWQTAWFNRINLNDYQYFYVSGYEMENTSSANLLLDQLAERNDSAKVLFDASPRISYIAPEIIHRLLKKGFIINANEDEIGYLSQANSLADQVIDIYHQTQTPVMVTLGAKGTYFYDGKEGKIIASQPVSDVVNTIGAGDTHCGGVIAALLKGKSFEQACQIGNKLSAQVIKQEAGSLS